MYALFVTLGKSINTVVADNLQLIDSITFMKSNFDSRYLSCFCPQTPHSHNLKIRFFAHKYQS